MFVSSTATKKAEESGWQVILECESVWCRPYPGNLYEFEIGDQPTTAPTGTTAPSIPPTSAGGWSMERTTCDADMIQEALCGPESRVLNVMPTLVPTQHSLTSRSAFGLLLAKLPVSPPSLKLRARWL